jgi:hypothetical protein
MALVDLLSCYDQLVCASVLAEVLVYAPYPVAEKHLVF